MKQKKFLQILTELLKKPTITEENQQKILEQLKQSGVLTEEEISPENLQKIAEKIANQQRKDNFRDNVKIGVSTLGGLALIVLGLTLPGLGIMPFVMGSGLLISSALRVTSKLVRMALKAYIKNHHSDLTAETSSEPRNAEKWLKRLSRKNTDGAADLIIALTSLSGGIFGLSQGIILGLISIVLGLIAAGNFVINHKIIGLIKKLIMGEKNKENEENNEENEENNEEMTKETSLSSTESLRNISDRHNIDAATNNSALPQKPTKNSTTSSLNINNSIPLDNLNSSLRNRNSNLNSNKNFTPGQISKKTA
jgi:hypothetical protein